MVSKRFMCTVTTELHDEVIQLLERGLWPSQAAFVREAIEYALQRQHIRDQLAQSDLLDGREAVYPSSLEELLFVLTDLANQVTALRDRIGTETHISLLLYQLGLLQEQARICLYIGL